MVLLYACTTALKTGLYKLIITVFNNVSPSAAKVNANSYRIIGKQLINIRASSCKLWSCSGNRAA
jgi:hypothetical protein